MSKILIIRPSALGDTLLLGPALRQLSDSEEITLAGRMPGVDFLRPFLKNCIDYERGGWHTIFSERPDCDKIPTVESDMVISFLSDPLGVAQRGLQTCFKNIPVFSFPPFPHKKEKIHTALYLALCLKNSGLPLDPEKAVESAMKKPLFCKQDISKPAKAFVIHPGSGSKKKNYPSDFWLELIKGLNPALLNNLTMLLGPAELSRQKDLMKKLSAQGLNIVKSPDKEELLSIFRKTSLYIGHDSGITHLAAMTGVYTIALFRNSCAKQWSPIGPYITLFNNVRSPEIIYETIEDQLTKNANTSINQKNYLSPF